MKFNPMTRSNQNVKAKKMHLQEDFTKTQAAHKQKTLQISSNDARTNTFVESQN